MPEIELIEELERFNPWWRKDMPNLPTPLVKRELFDPILKSIKTNRVQTIYGLRQIGKTTLLYQLITQLLKNVTNEHILYYSFDMYHKEGVSIKSLIEAYLSQILKTPLMDLEKKTYIFLDEVHKLPNWSSEVKYYTDLQEKLRFVITGSSTMHITKGAGESLIGRTKLLQLHPFSFTEFLIFQGIKPEPSFDLFSQILNENPQIPNFRNSERLKIEFFRYCEFGGLPKVYSIKDQNERTNEIKIRCDLTLYRDILEIFNIRQPSQISALFYFLISNSAQVINYSTITNALKIKFETLKQYLEYLELSNLIQINKFYTQNPLKTIKKNPKIYISDHSFFQLNDCPQGRIMETIAQNHLYRIIKTRYQSSPYYWSTNNGREVDMVVKTKNITLPVEIKYKKIISKNDLKGLLAFQKKFKIKNSLLVTEQDEGNTEIETSIGKLQIIKLPMWKFLLSR